VREFFGRDDDPHRAGDLAVLLVAAHRADESSPTFTPTLPRRSVGGTSTRRGFPNSLRRCARTAAISACCIVPASRVVSDHEMSR
jgi:hypothetical protein